jgi:hypothetical protein
VAIDAPGRFGIKDNQQDPCIRALPWGLAMAYENIAGHAQQMIRVVDNIGHNNAGFV